MFAFGFGKFSGGSFAFRCFSTFGFLAWLLGSLLLGGFLLGWRRPTADLFQRESEFLGFGFQQRLERRACRLVVFGIDFGMPLVNPWQQLIESGEQWRQSLGVQPSFLRAS